MYMDRVDLDSTAGHLTVFLTGVLDLCASRELGPTKSSKLPHPAKLPRAGIRVIITLCECGGNVWSAMTT
jgi:hypothetical protein